jgi:type VI secretion system secreted protein Hcp
MKLTLSKALLPSLVFATLLCLPFRSQAAYKMYLLLTGVSGEANNNLIAIDSFQFGMSVVISTGGGGGGAGKASFSDVTLTKQLDVSSPLLALDCAKGQNIATGVLTVVDSTSGNTLYTVTLGTVVISSVSTAGGGDRPTESISLHFQTIQWTYQKLDGAGQPDGPPVSHNWNVGTNTGS